jgi:hypothetical protein
VAHEPATGEEIVLEVEVPEGASDADAVAAVVGLADAADDLHRAHGGHGLRVVRPQAEGADVTRERDDGGKWWRVPDDWEDDGLDAALARVQAAHRREFLHTLRHLGVCLAVIALAALAAWAVRAFP